MISIRLGGGWDIVRTGAGFRLWLGLPRSSGKGRKLWNGGQMKRFLDQHEKLTE
jgi:hypothetical protein